MPRLALLIPILAVAACAHGGSYPAPAPTPAPPPQPAPASNPIPAPPPAASTSGIPASATATAITTPQLYFVCNHPGFGAPSPREGNAVEIVTCDSSGENNGIDLFAVNGYGQYPCERYDYSDADGRFHAPPAYEAVCNFGAAAYDGQGDPFSAGMKTYTTELWSPANNGMMVCLEATANGETGTYEGVCLSPQGKRGLVVGGHVENGAWMGPPDLGPGSLDVQGPIGVAGKLGASAHCPNGVIITEVSSGIITGAHC